MRRTDKQKTRQVVSNSFNDRPEPLSFPEDFGEGTEYLLQLRGDGFNKELKDHLTGRKESNSLLRPPLTRKTKTREQMKRKGIIICLNHPHVKI